MNNLAKVIPLKKSLLINLSAGKITGYHTRTDKTMMEQTLALLLEVERSERVEQLLNERD